jgi:oxygen-independent coproporphyrinogen-3 oxidase
LPPDVAIQHPARIRVTPAGRLVLNAVVAKLSGNFERAERVDNLQAAV